MVGIFKNFFLNQNVSVVESLNKDSIVQYFIKT